MQQYELANLYKEIELKTSNGGNLIIMMYTEIIKLLEQAVHLLQTDTHRAYDTINGNITKSQELITELIISLDKKANETLYNNLLHLYLYFNKELREANFSKDATKIIPVIDCIKELLTAWQEAVKTTNTTTPVKRNGINISR